jgi:hypothetical protein
MPPAGLYSPELEEVVPTLLFPVIVLSSVCGKGLRMEQNHQKAIEEIMGGVTCPKDFKCYKLGFENLCKAKEVGLETFLECLEEHPQECAFSLDCGDYFYCTCPLRVYISKKFKK